jgi:hypothetical protein
MFYVVKSVGHLTTNMKEDQLLLSDVGEEKFRFSKVIFGPVIII